MSASPSRPVDTAACQLAAALERYALEVDAMVDTWLDMDRYDEVSRRIEEVRMHSQALPHLRAAWMELLIAHAELVHALWCSEFAQGSPQCAGLRARHGERVAALRQACLRGVAVH